LYAYVVPFPCDSATRGVVASQAEREEIAMLEMLDGLPDQVLGFAAKGEVTAEDYRQLLVPAVESKLGTHRKLRLLYILGADFSGFTGAAAWEDAKVGMRHFTSFERIAVVSDIDWVRHMVKAFGFVVPGEVRVYDVDAADEARSWVCEATSHRDLEFELNREKGILILEPHDELEAEDFRRVAAEIDPYMAHTGHLSGVVIVAEEFPGWDDFAALTAHFRFVREHQSRVRRVAVVTDSRFLSALPRIAGVFVAAEVRSFAMNERDAALSWVSESSTASV
jgi:SpoIIAA-like